MFTIQHIEEAKAENADLAYQWEQYAVELHLEGADEADLDICLEEANLHWEWYSLWCDRLAVAQEWAEYDSVFNECEYEEWCYDPDYDVCIDFLHKLCSIAEEQQQLAQENLHLDYQYGYVHAYV